LDNYGEFNGKLTLAKSCQIRSVATKRKICTNSSNAARRKYLIWRMKILYTVSYNLTSAIAVFILSGRSG
jgi:hypothetical protein